MPRHAQPFQIVVRRDTGGKPIFHARFRDEAGELRPWTSTGQTSRSAARSWAQTQLKSGRAGINRTLSFRRWAEPWWKWDECEYIRGKLARGQRLSKSYADNQRGNLDRYILPTFGMKPLSKITPGTIETWAMNLHDKHGLSRVTINRNLVTLKVMFAEAYRLGIVASNPAARVAPRHEIPKDRQVLAEREIQSLFAESAIGPVWNGDEHAFTASMIAVSCGVRIGEIQALTIGSVQGDMIVVLRSWGRKYGLKEPKYGQLRQVPVPGRTRLHFDRIIEDSPPGPLKAPGRSRR